MVVNRPTPPSLYIPLAPINPIHGLMLFWAATIRLPICLLDLHLMNLKYLFNRLLELMSCALPGSAFSNKLPKAPLTAVNQDKVKDRRELNELTFPSSPLLHRK